MILLVTGVLIAAVLALGAYYLVRQAMELSVMRPVPAGEPAPGVVAVNYQFVNFWLVKGPDGWLAVDCGTDAGPLRAALASQGIAVADVKVVLLTHSNYDHAGGLDALPGVPVFIADGASLLLAGLLAQIILTPGHTPGSTCWLVGGGLLFTGDAFAIKDGNMAPFNDFFNMDSARARESQATLRGVKGVKAVFTAHYGVSNDWVALTAP
jgi:glyoxylase-like metal-dependent hydrolase (beta-lactamase superfamily II)